MKLFISVLALCMATATLTVVSMAEQDPAMRKVVQVTNYSISPDDPNDFISMMPGKMELAIVSHYHYYRVGMDSVRSQVPAGSVNPDAVFLAEGDNDPESELIVGDIDVMNEHTFRLDIDASNTKIGDNFILYFTTVGKSVKDWRWPNWPAAAGTPRSFQIHLHIGPSMDEYVDSLK